MNLSNIIAATRNRISFSFFPPNSGDNALMTIKDGNSIISQINNMISYRMYDFMITQQAPSIQPALIKLAASATECPHSCDCKLYNCDCKCADEGNASASAFFVVTNTGPGIFTFTINVPPAYAAKQDNPLKHVALVFSGLAVPGFVTVVPTSAPNVLTVTTLNAAGIPDNFIFNKTIVQARLYFTKL